MYCAQCGTELSDGAKFCVNCGTPVPSQKENTVKAVAKQVQPKTNWFPKETVGKFYHHFLMMLSDETQDYFDSITSRYETLDAFVRRGEQDITEIFSHVDAFLIGFMQIHGVYQYGEKQIAPYTHKYIGYWADAFNVALEAYQNITGEEQRMRQYREMRKAGRGQVIGGGFGFSGAVKGMATAGAINMTTGLLHSFANAWGNANSAAEADRQKRSFFYNMEYRENLLRQICNDCYNMLQGFAELWNSLGKEKFPFYSEEDRDKAWNIADAIHDGRVPSDQMDSAIDQMIALYPIEPGIYNAAVALRPARKEKYCGMARRYGIDLHEQQKQLQSQAQKYAEQLVNNPMFYACYDYLIDNVEDTIDVIAEQCEDFGGILCDNFMIFNEKYRTKYSSKIRSAYNSYVHIRKGEIPILMFSSKVWGGGDKGIFLTDKNLYVSPSGYREPERQYALEDVTSVELIKKDNGCKFIRINDEAEAQTYDSIENSAVIAIIEFFCAYCSFLSYNSTLTTSEDFAGGVLQYTNLTREDLDERFRSDDELEDDDDDFDESEETKFCFECGAENDADAEFCAECGASLI